MPRKIKTSKERKATLFRYRIIITVPSWGVPVVAGVSAWALLVHPILLTNIICLTTSIACLILTYAAGRLVRKLRFDVHEALNNIGNDELDEVVTDMTEHISLRKINDQPSSRISG